PQASYVGVTGTNGKSTTTALIGHILNESNIDNRVGGNIGSPVLALDPLSKGGFFVLEMSSYQLELTPSAAFNIAVMLNVSADHLDRHGGMAGYIEAKKLIFANQAASNIAIIGIDDAPSKTIYTSLKAEGVQHVIPISSHARVDGGVYVLNGVLYDSLDGQHREILNLSTAHALPGAHNWQNAAAAYATTKSAGADEQGILDALNTYPGLPHRQELVAVIDGVSYVNDSKATNADAAARALACYDIICWIAGGQTKDNSLDAITPFTDRIKTAYLIGEATDVFAGALPESIAIERCGTLDIAVQRAREGALQECKNGNPVVLLSPACASFDQFKDFEDRGDAFRQFVETLPGYREQTIKRVH
ncbi:MAG: UDP-N-acetylmuramoyl-L-alanine--D-glutamate ligase, partial [Rhodospirillales bacterium]